MQTAPKLPMLTGDTIAAISSAVGPAARMIVRASGPGSREIHQQITASEQFIAARAEPAVLHFNQLLIPSWVYTFAAPASVTGEDVLELHIPGNPVLARMLLEEVIRLGARQAEPGEFTARAYFNGRIDLTEAEGVAATIAAQSERELIAARQLLAGELAKRLAPVLDLVAETLALIEVGIDFVEEDVTFLSDAQIASRLDSAITLLNDLVAGSARLDRLTHEPRIVLTGRPNAGKSTLLNLLSGQDRAVVSPQAGTTRDAIWSHVRLRRGIIRLIDVAGIELPADADPIETQMQSRASQTIEEADFILLLHDASDTSPRLQLSRSADLVIVTKIDATSAVTSGDLSISAQTGKNIQLLRDKLDELVFGKESQIGAALALNSRHLSEIEQSIASLSRARQSVSHAGLEVIALDLREALDSLGRILGSVSPDDLLGRVFSLFCIGK